MVITELMALNARANAERFWPEMHFCDRAANALTGLLNTDARVRFCPLDERRYLRANYWVDQQCLAFFNQYPKGMGIECGAGLSTRFHRLSEQHEWPQFSWIDIDSEVSLAPKSTAMPKIDNYRLVASDSSIEELVTTIQWNKTTPLMIVIDGLSHSVDVKWLKSLLSALLAARHDKISISLVIVLEKSSRWYEKILRLVGLSIFGKWKSLADDLGGDISYIKYFGKNIQGRSEMVSGFSLNF